MDSKPDILCINVVRGEEEVELDASNDFIIYEIVVVISLIFSHGRLVSTRYLINYYL
jgi:hypothetical protein